MRLLWMIIVGTAMLLTANVPTAAHDGPEHEIDELTQQIKAQGESADLLIQRAIEYKILGKLSEAAKDLERALDLENDSLTARRELSQTYFSWGKTNEALATATRGLKSPGDAPEQASLLVVRAGILRARRQYAKALADLNEAIEKHSQNVEWYLIRSQVQAILKLKAERVQGLTDGVRETGSGLLSAELLDAMIENGQYREAGDKIEHELRDSRWKAAWLIRRAKVGLATNQSQEAKQDLAAAVDELNRRLSAGGSDALLLADRAVAFDLLGKKDEARRDYRAARDKGLTDEWVRERIRALRDSEKDDE